MKFYQEVCLQSLKTKRGARRTAWRFFHPRGMTNHLDRDFNFRQLYLQNYSSENFEILTRSVFESQLQKTLNEPFPKKSSFEDIIVGS